MTERDQNESQKEWSEHCTSFLIFVMTEAFISGIDSPNVPKATIMGGMRNMLDLWQIVGRAGHDGSPTACELYFYEFHCQRANGGNEIAPGSAEHEFIDWASDDSICNRIWLEVLLGDATFLSRYCLQRHNCNICSLCDLILMGRKTIPERSASYAVRRVQKLIHEELSPRKIIIWKNYWNQRCSDSGEKRARCAAELWWASRVRLLSILLHQRRIWSKNTAN